MHHLTISVLSVVIRGIIQYSVLIHIRDANSTFNRKLSASTAMSMATIEIIVQWKNNRVLQLSRRHHRYQVKLFLAHHSLSKAENVNN